jgi:proton-translocating NADH-quinone oxidoreductase chain M
LLKIKNIFKQKFNLFKQKINNVSLVSVKQSLNKNSFIKTVILHRYYDYAHRYNIEQTTEKLFEWIYYFIILYIYNFYNFITMPFFLFLNYLKKFNYLIKLILLSLMLLYFYNNFEIDFSFFFIMYNKQYFIYFTLIYIILCLIIQYKNSIKKIEFMFYEYDNKDLIISLIIWVLLARFLLVKIYENFWDLTDMLDNNNASGLRLIFFPIMVSFFISLVIFMINKFDSYIKYYSKREKLTKYERIIYPTGKKLSNEKKTILFFILSLNIYLISFYLTKYFYTKIYINLEISLVLVQIYFWLIIFLYLLIPRFYKTLIQISKEYRLIGNQWIKFLPIFSIIFYLVIFYIQKFYYHNFNDLIIKFNFLSLTILLLLIITIIFLIFIPSYFLKIFKFISFFITTLIYFLSLFFWINFDRTTPKFQFIIDISSSNFLGLDIILGLDGISLFFILLTTLISPLLVLISWDINKNVKSLNIILLLTELLIILTFTSLDLFIFYISFESILIPLFLSIIIWGSRRRKIKAAKMLFIYTLISSIFFLIALFTLYLEIGSTNFFSILNYCNTGLSFNKQCFLWLLLFLAFAIKIPLYPLHTWLPEAHVEAPTFGSVILASLLLKTGGYGIYRFVLPLFPEANIYFNPLIFMLALMGVFYGAFASIRQIDMKRIIAYLSVSHMNLCVLGQFSETLEGLIGGLLLMVAHGLIAAGFFISVGFLYERYHTRLIYYYGGLVRIMPVFAISLFIFVLANMNMPGTSNFIGELLILTSIGYKSFTICLIAAIGSAVGALCTIWFWNRLMFGELKIQYFDKFTDINRREFAIIFPLLIFNFFIGIFSNEIIDTCYSSVYFLYTFLLF